MRFMNLARSFAMFLCVPMFGNTLYFPRVHNDAAFDTGIAVSSTEGTTGKVQLTLVAASGQVLRRVELAMPASGQLVGTLKDLIQAPDDFGGWLRVDSAVDLDGMGILFRRSDGLITESPAIRVPDGFQYFAHVAIGSGWRTELSIANTTEHSVDCKALLYDARGTLLATKAFSLGPLGQSVLDAGVLFPIQSLLSGHIEVVSDGPLVAAETFRTQYGIATVPAEGNIREASNGKWTLFFPYVSNRGNEWTGIAFVNQTGAAANVFVELVAGDGSVVSLNRQILEAKSQFVFNVSDFAGNWHGTGYVRVTSDSAVSGLQITGTGDPGTSNFAGWSAQRNVARQLFIPHVAEVPGWASQISLVNTSSTSAIVTIDVLDQQGSGVSSKVIPLAAGQQVFDQLLNLVPVQGKGGGSLRISSTQPLIGANLFRSPRGVAAVSAAPATNSEARQISSILVASKTIRAAEGGELSIPFDPPGAFMAGLRLAIPPGALDRDTEVQISVTPATLARPITSLQLVQFPLRFLPEGLQFKKPVKLSYPVSADVLKNQPGRLQTINILTFDDLSKTWVTIPTTRVDTINYVVEADLTHFSTYGAMQPALRRRYSGRLRPHSSRF